MERGRYYQQRAQLAINNLKQQYCQPLLSTTSTTSAQPSDQSASTSKSRKSTESRPTTLTSDPFQLQPPNPACHILRLQGTMENNTKVEKLQQYISDKHKKHLTEVFKLFIYATIIQLFLHHLKYFSTHIYTVIHTFKLLIYTFNVPYITLFFLLFLYQLYINQSVTPLDYNLSQWICKTKSVNFQQVLIMYQNYQLIIG